jgi:hypothetical protein
LETLRQQRQTFDQINAEVKKYLTTVKENAREKVQKQLAGGHE